MIDDDILSAADTHEAMRIYSMRRRRAAEPGGHYLDSVEDRMAEVDDASLVERIEAGIKLQADYVEIRRGEIREDMRSLAWSRFNYKPRIFERFRVERVCSGPWAPKRKRPKRVAKRIAARDGAMRFRSTVTEHTIMPRINPVERFEVPIFQIVAPRPQHPNAMIVGYRADGYVIAAADLSGFRDWTVRR